ncbi:tetratricopeptide repeat protein [Microtetraspora malaysiensis]|uniref:tetratricopeptide repeat protein n=1 Tax=Microtetraspora malaysiensis TaxID=161358 RepID=UPI000B1EAF5C|nr:hypothetical protein [Microtetraspora malaysiensis]
MGSDIEDPDHARYQDRDRAGNLARDHVPRRSPGTDPRSWCLLAAERLERDRPEAALEAARQAIERDPGGEWGHRLAGLALERLGRDAEAVAAAREAVRLAPGSWAARLRLGGALRRTPDGWREAWAEARKAVAFAPEEPDPHVLVGDLALLRGDHERAVASYQAALRLSRDHPVARVNLGLALLRWERPRTHHDPAWAADPRETTRARRALDVWSRQVRVLLAVATVVVTAAALGLGLHREAQIGGALVLGGVVAVTVRQAGRVPVWSRVPAMLRRDLWFTMNAAMALAVVGAYVAGLATLPTGTDGIRDGVWAGACGIVLLNGVAAGALRLFAEAWRGRPVRALAHFAAAGPVPAARRNADVALWILAGRAWWALALLLSLCVVAAQPRLAVAAVAVPGTVALAVRRGGVTSLLRATSRRDRPLALTLALLAVAALLLALAGAAPGRALAGVPAVPALGTAGSAACAALAGAAGAFAVRAARAWWSGAPGPWRSALIPCESRGRRLPGDASPPPGVSDAVRHAATYSRSVVLAYTQRGCPRALAVSAVTSVSASGELRLIAGDEAWEAVERDPRVVLFVGDPRFWAEVRGVAVPSGDVLRITPKRVVVREYPGRHQARAR